MELAVFVTRYVGYPVTSCHYCEEMFLYDNGIKLRAHITTLHERVLDQESGVLRPESARARIQRAANRGPLRFSSWRRSTSS